MDLLNVKGLSKKYPLFTLDNVNISLGEGCIMGFIGRNGAGKTTTLKCMLNLIHADAGEIELCGMKLYDNEIEIKQQTGFVSGGADFYQNMKIGKITSVTKSFYRDWDEKKYKELCERFEIDQNKKIKELSAGMKVKYNIAVALSHNSKLLILDEPTSGLDPAARDDLILLFQDFIDDGKHSILFSTHITSDLEKCADYITYIQNGKILNSTTKDAFKENYLLVSGSDGFLDAGKKEKLIGLHIHQGEFEGLIVSENKDMFDGCKLSNPTLDDIMIHIERR